MRNDFACFILCHGHPENVVTFDTLKKRGYTGKIYIICDDEDKTLQGYIDRFGKDSVKIFNKLEILKRMDTMDTSTNRGCAVYARNACFDIAKELGLKYFCELDDDYKEFFYRYPDNNKLGFCYPSHLNDCFEAILTYLENNKQITSIAVSQGGDLIGGLDSFLNLKLKRKCMNSWFCSVDREFTFNGRMNDDVNTYCIEGSRGKLFMTIPDCQINQPLTQNPKGGMTEMYKQAGTYQKSFYTVMLCPSFCKISVIRQRYYRIHHHIDWEYAVPKIISSKYKKKGN